jgi:hypothetical protein
MCATGVRFAGNRVDGEEEGKAVDPERAALDESARAGKHDARLHSVRLAVIATVCAPFLRDVLFTC